MNLDSLQTKIIFMKFFLYHEWKHRRTSALNEKCQQQKTSNVLRKSTLINYQVTIRQKTELKCEQGTISHGLG